MDFSRYRLYAKTVGFRPVIGANLLALHLGAVVFEGIGVVMLLPILELIQSDGDVAALAAQSTLWQGLVDGFAMIGLPTTLLTLIGTALACIAARQGFKYFQMVYKARAYHGLVQDIRNRAFGQCLNATSKYHDTTPAGDIVNDLVVEAPRAVTAIFSLIRCAGAVLLVLVYMGLLFALSPGMTLVLVGVVLVEGLLFRDIMRRSRETSAGITEANRRVSEFLVERLRSLRLIRLSRTGKAEADNMGRLTAAQRDRSVFLAVMQARIPLIVEPLAIATSLAFLYLGATVFAHPLETLVVYLAMVLRILPVIKETVQTYQKMLAHSASMDSIHRRLRIFEHSGETEGGSLVFHDLRNAIRYEHVTFDYRAGADLPALDDISVEIPAGKITALVGPSGGGKSTMIDLLPRLRDPVSGTIYFDDTPLAEFRLDSLRAGIAYVPQSPQIFNTTIAQHIHYGWPEATDQEIQQAARLSGAAQFIDRLPEGFDTVVGEDGVLLSGGERQRLDLARALLRRSPILILDEPTSDLDPDAQERVNQALLCIRHTTQTTILLIAHTLRSVAHADQIVVLQEGGVAAIGTHEELLRQGGWYATAVATEHRVRQLSTLSTLVD